MLTLLPAEPAQACSGSYAYDVPGAYPTVPANGGALVSYHCRRFTSGCAWSEELTVLLDGEVVPGTFVHHGEDYTFIPQEPLEVGAVYTVPDFGDVTAVEAVPVDLASIELDVFLDVHGTLAPHDEVCCEEAADSCGIYPCWLTEEIEQTYAVSLVAQLDESALEVARSELRFSWTTSNGDSGETDWFAGKDLELRLAEKADEYCIIPELRSLLTGETLALDEHCVQHGDLPAPGDTDVVVPNPSPAELSMCPVPVDVFIDQWCTGNQARCDDNDNRACMRVREQCPRGALCSVGAVGLRPSRSWVLVLMVLLAVAARWRGQSSTAAYSRR